MTKDVHVAIRTTTGNDRELAAVAQLERILATYDLSRWCFTDVCRIQSMAIPRSHPVLRLNTRHLADDHQALSTFLHEQLHWWLHQHPAIESAMEAVQVRWSDPPGHREGGAANPFSTWLHLVLCPIEIYAVEAVLGHDLPVETRGSGPYAWIYQQVLADRAWFSQFLAERDLVPPATAATPIRWEPLVDLDVVKVYGERSSPNEQLVELIRQTHEGRALPVGETEVIVNSERPTGMHPSLSVGAEHVDDPDAFALVYAFGQAAFWGAADRQAQEVIAAVPEEIATAVGGPPFGASTAVAGTLVLDALGEPGIAAIERTSLAGRLTPLVPHLDEIRRLLHGAGGA